MAKTFKSLSMEKKERLAALPYSATNLSALLARIDMAKAAQDYMAVFPKEHMNAKSFERMLRDIIRNNNNFARVPWNHKVRLAAAGFNIRTADDWAAASGLVNWDAAAMSFQPDGNVNGKSCKKYVAKLMREQYNNPTRARSEERAIDSTEAPEPEIIDLTGASDSSSSSSSSNNEDVNNTTEGSNEDDEDGSKNWRPAREESPSPEARETSPSSAADTAASPAASGSSSHGNGLFVTP